MPFARSSVPRGCLLSLAATLLPTTACVPPPPCEAQATAAALAYGMEGGDHRCLAGATVRVEDGRVAEVDLSTASCPVDAGVWVGVAEGLVDTRVSDAAASCRVPLLKDGDFGTTKP